MQKENFKNEDLFVEDVDTTEAPVEVPTEDNTPAPTTEVVEESIVNDSATVVIGPRDLVAGVVTGCLKLAIRKEAKSDADVVRVVNALTKVTVDLGKSTEEWYKVSTDTGIGGFCMKKFVTVK